MIYPLVILYNKACQDSETCISLLKQTYPELSVVVFDNSTKDYGNRAYCQEKGWTYLGGQGNQGLSKAYNQAADWLVSQNKPGYLCLLDDDTDLPDTFFSDMAFHIQAHNSGQLYIPVLMQNGRIISPSRRTCSRKNQFFETKEACMQEQPDNLQAFNSCMTISLDVFRDYRYDERLFLDCVDHAFLRDMRQRGVFPTVLPVVCQHGFSGNQKGSLEGAKVRFRIYAQDMKVYFGDQRAQFRSILIRRAIHLCLLHKTSLFMKLAFQYL